jgi:hypothetical protein
MNRLSCGLRTSAMQRLPDRGCVAAFKPGHYAAAMSERYQLAQVNIALPLAPLNTPQLAEFMHGLAPINALADASPGFVWRLQSADGDATAIHAFADDRLLINMSVWATLETLGDFVYRSAHTTYLRRRRGWFARLAESVTALWWLPVGQLPTIGDAEQRLATLRQHGPTPDAFTFQQPFPPPANAESVGADPDGLSLAARSV